jgi:acylphosphatase
MNSSSLESNEKPRRMTALVRGLVQGIGYRRFVQRRAKDLGLTGSAENLDGGDVEIVAEGASEELERLLHWIERGPAHAKVKSVEVQWSEATGMGDFYVF